MPRRWSRCKAPSNYPRSRRRPHRWRLPSKGRSRGLLRFQRRYHRTHRRQCPSTIRVKGPNIGALRNVPIKKVPSSDGSWHRRRRCQGNRFGPDRIRHKQRDSNRRERYPCRYHRTHHRLNPCVVKQSKGRGPRCWHWVEFRGATIHAVIIPEPVSSVSKACFQFGKLVTSSSPADCLTSRLDLGLRNQSGQSTRSRLRHRSRRCRLGIHRCRNHRTPGK